MLFGNLSSRRAFFLAFTKKSIYLPIEYFSMDKIDFISAKLGLSHFQVANSVKLFFEESATIPFVSRYRKEATGGLDEVVLESLYTEYRRLSELEKRKESIEKSIAEQGALTDALKTAIAQCTDAQVLEDIYLPFRPKRRTRATIAREKGLEPLALMMLRNDAATVLRAAPRFVTKEVASSDDAVQGAQDIVAEIVSEHRSCRDIVRKTFLRDGILSSKVIKGKETEGNKFSNYFEFSEKISRMAANRYLAVTRGENESILRVTVRPDDEEILVERLCSYFSKNNPHNPLRDAAIKDGYTRLLRPSIETETRSFYKERSDESAIQVFSSNLRELLLAAPLGGKNTLAIDPGFRTGCKVVCLDANGELKHNETIYPHPPQNDTTLAMKKLSTLVEAYKIEAIAVGNGTAGRETETFVQRIRFDRKVEVFLVNEDGASVYSASAIAREEFPTYDVTVRGAVSIGRRLMDPLAELVKIDPKSVGVGEYQHDVDQSKLKEALDRVVESCVNYVGVDLNTASPYLLTYVSGIGPALAKKIVEYRSANGSFTSRYDLMKVPRFGEKVFEQSAGFLRITNGENPLDNSSVHPESYGIVAAMASSLGITTTELIGNAEWINKININQFKSDTISSLTLDDIMNEIRKPGRDPRESVQHVEFDPNVKTIEDLKEGMFLNGVVTNITSFGAFVNLGIKQDGLIHISNLANKFVSNPGDIVKLNQQVRVKVMEIDRERNRIGLSLKETEE